MRTRTGRYNVYGLSIETEQDAKLTRKVINVSCAMTLLALGSWIIGLAGYGHLIAAGLVAAVFIPCCGACGASSGSRFWITAYVVSCLVLAIWWCIAFLIELIRFRGDYVGCACSATCVADHGWDPVDAADVCRNLGRYRGAYWVSVGLGCASAALQFAGAHYGMKLLKSQTMFVNGVPGEVVEVPAAVVATTPGGDVVVLDRDVPVIVATTTTAAYPYGAPPPAVIYGGAHTRVPPAPAYPGYAAPPPAQYPPPGPGGAPPAYPGTYPAPSGSRQASPAPPYPPHPGKAGMEGQQQHYGGATMAYPPAPPQAYTAYPPAYQEEGHHTRAATHDPPSTHGAGGNAGGGSGPAPASGSGSSSEASVAPSTRI